MILKRIRTQYDSDITGVRNGAPAVWKTAKSFCDKKTSNLFDDFFAQNLIDISRIRMASYLIFDKPKDFSLTYYPKTKSVKQVDFLTYAPYLNAIQFLVSERVKNIIEQYKTPLHNEIPVNISTFNNGCYFLLGFPIIDFDHIDFSKSLFLGLRGKVLNFKDVSEYCSYGCSLDVKELYVHVDRSYDIVSTVWGDFVSDTLINALEKANISGYEIDPCEVLRTHINSEI